MLAGLTFLIGCQGVSAGGSGSPGQSSGTLSLASTKLDFGRVTVGASKTLSITATNSGTASFTISAASSSTKYFSLTAPSLPVTLTAGQTATVGVQFTPNEARNFAATFTIISDASNSSASLALSGTGSTSASPGTLTVTPSATLDVGPVVVGTSGSASGTLTANGADVTVTGATTNNSVFTVGGLSLPVTILSGQSVPFTVTFSPLITGAATATLTLSSNAQPSTVTEALAGNGATASTHSVALSWSSSASSGIAGYNVYRAIYTSSCGSFSKINGSLDANTVYTDSNVVNSTAYCYASTAVDTSNQESAYSNVVSNVQIPAQ